MMKIGNILITAEGLEALAKSIRTLDIKYAMFEVHQDEDTHGEIRICCSKEAGWIDLTKGYYQNKKEVQK